MAAKTEIYENFLGIDNRNDTAQIIKRPRTTFGGRSAAQIRMIQAENVDLHADNYYSRCDGYSLSLAGDYKSVWSNDKICLGINAGDLVKINPSFLTSLLMSGVGSYDMAYETVNDGSESVVYFTNGDIIGKVRKDVASSLPATTKEFKAPLPAGNHIRYFQGGLYVVKDKILYISDVLNREIYDRRWGFKLFETTITMFETVKDGFYVSDFENVYFMKRTGSTQEVIAAPIYTIDKVFDKPTVPGTAQKAYNIVSPAKKRFDQAVIWVSGNTLCVGGDDGAFETIREDVYAVPSGRVGTSIFRKSGDLNQYITVIR